MTSQIDELKPVTGTPTTASVRANFATAKSEISALQDATNGGPFLPLAGGSLVGPLYLDRDPTDPRQVVNKAYVDASGGGGGGGGIPDAPADGGTYGRSNGAWKPVVPSLGAGDVSLGGNLMLAGNYLHLAGSTGAAGPYLYGDAATMSLRLGAGNGNFTLLDSGGTTRHQFDAAGSHFAGLDISAGRDVVATRNLSAGGNYLYLAGGSGAVNAVGGPFLYADGTNLILHVGGGNGTVTLQDSAGTGRISLNPATGAIAAGAIATNGNLTVQTGTIYLSSVASGPYISASAAAFVLRAGSGNGKLIYQDFSGAERMAVDTAGNWWLRGVPFLSCDNTNSGYNKLYDNSGSVAIFLGWSGDSIHRNTSHLFQSRDGTVGFLRVDATQVLAYVPLNAQAGVNITAGGLAISTGNLVVGGTGYFGAAVTIHGGGNAALNVDNGGATIAGGLAVGQPAIFGGTVTIHGGGAVALNVDNGGIGTAGDVTCALTLRGGSGDAGNVRCYGTGDFINFRWDGFPYLRVNNAYERALVVSNANNIYQVNYGSAGPTGTLVEFTATNGTAIQVYADQAVSDARLKDKIADSAIDALAVLCAIPVRQFEWTAEAIGEFASRAPGLSPDEQQAARDNAEPLPVAIGLVAQEVAPHVPDAVVTRPDEMLGLKRDELWPYAIRAIQQLEARLAALETRRSS